MMTSNLLSRILPANITTGRSIYDELRAHDAASESDPDVEERAGLALDEQNLQFHDDELANADAFNGEDSHMTTESTAFLQRKQTRGADNPGTRNPRERQPKWVAQSPRLLDEDGDDDVPASLLIEGHDMLGPSAVAGAGTQRGRTSRNKKRQAPIPGPASKENRAQWETAQVEQRLHREEMTPRAPQPARHNVMLMGTPRDKAMWRWINVINLDNFLHDVYQYYTEYGIWCMILARILSLLQGVFIVGFVTFLTQCIDWSNIRGRQKFSEIYIYDWPKRMSAFTNVILWFSMLFFFWKIYQGIKDIPRLMKLRDFFTYLLEIPDSDMQTISWQDVVARLMALRDANPNTDNKLSPQSRKYLGSQSKQRLDAHDIANRLMRRENYLIALFNKDKLDLTIPFPFLHDQQIFTRTLLWCLDYAIMGLLFDEAGQVTQHVLKESQRRRLSDALRTRFRFAAFMNALFAPGLIFYFLIMYFFKYFKLYQQNPSAIGIRQYTPLAEWKFREFNELEHIFHKRLNMSYPFASRYLDQFPKVKMAHIAKFVSFVSGSIVSVLLVASLLDSELFLGFEITPGKTVLFYLGAFGAVWAFMNGSIPEENLVFEPEYALRNVIEYTHYMPENWQDRLHSDDVKREFADLYQMKIMIFLTEVLCIVVTPFVLSFSLANCSDQIIDFFREFTVHVDGIGYVCSFAVFDFKKGDGRKALHGGGHADARDDYYSTKHGKMAASYYGFLDNYLLNPKTAVQGHVPPGVRHNFHPPPTFPGLMSPTLGADMQTSRMGRSERRPGSRAPIGGPQTARTPRFPPAMPHGSPMQSILLDPHHQPSNSGFGGRSARRTLSRSRYQTRQNILEEPIEDEEEPETRPSSQAGGPSRPQYESTAEASWEMSPTRGSSKNINEEEEETDEGPTAGGVLGLLYQFQKAQRNTGGPLDF